MKPLLEIRQLHVAYGAIKVLHGIDLTVPEGSITTLLGANGAGKTTTLRAICQMVPTQGSVHIGGRRADGMGTDRIVRLGVAHVPEGRGTFLGLSTEENLQIGAYTRNDARAVLDDLEIIYGYFPRLKERRKQQAGTLSGGEQQMLAIGRALMSRPRLLLLDEPSFGLAPLVVKDIFGILRRINREQKLAVLLVEQNAALALDLADQAYLLEQGRIAIAGSSTQVKSDPNIRRAYLGD